MTPLAGRLARLGLLRFSGADAAAFLQGQITNDLRRLASAQPLLGAQTNVQGRVLAVLNLVPHSSGILAILPDELAAPTARSLAKFVLRAKVRIEPVGADELVVAGQHGTQTLLAAGCPLPQPAAGYVEWDGIGIGRVAADPGRCWIIGARTRLDALGFGGDPVDAARIEHDWRLADVRAGVPQVYAATRESFVPQMLNLDLVGAISFTKGCYTGQEIVARTQHLGRIKRRLLRVALRAAGGSGAPSVGGLVRFADGRSGRLSEIQAVDGGFEGLAVAPLEPAGAAAEPAEDTAAPAGAEAPPLVTQLPLPYALAPAP
ncbi:MAG TPA: hypothetical protein VND80_05055 [Steroidobacteraceae bacterium]|nr:hypothetical protein [Steroidobacteraceae bacterium]